MTIKLVIFQDLRTIFTPEQCFVIFLLIIDVIAMGRALLEGSRGITYVYFTELEGESSE